jgi:hypothetical protein
MPWPRGSPAPQHGPPGSCLFIFFNFFILIFLIFTWEARTSSARAAKYLSEKKISHKYQRDYRSQVSKRQGKETFYYWITCRQTVTYEPLLTR